MNNPISDNFLYRVLYSGISFPLKIIRNEEIIVMRYGNAVMNINGKPYEAEPSSIYFLAGNDPHGIVNKGAVP